MIVQQLTPVISGAALRERFGQRHNVEVKIVPANWLNGNRISTHLFNTDQDVAALRAELA